MQPFIHPMMGRGGAGIVPAVTTWDPVNKGAGIVLTGSNLICSDSSAGNFENVQTSTQKSSGKLYLEVTNVLTQSQAGGVPGIGFVIPSFNLNTFLTSGGGGYDVLTYGQARDDSNASVSVSYPVWNTAGDILQVAVDLGARKWWVKKVGGASWNDGVGSPDPATGVNGLPMGANPGAAGVPVVLAGMPYSNAIKFAINCGQSAFAGAVPSGYGQWG